MVCGFLLEVQFLVFLEGGVELIIIISNYRLCMEKLDGQKYRDELAQKIKEIRNSDSENQEVSKAKAEGYLEGSQESSEYKASKVEHLGGIQQKLKEKAEEVRKVEQEILQKQWEESRQKRVELMKEIVEALPFEYIPVEGHNSVLLKSKESDHAFLVGNSLDKVGSQYGIRTAGEKIFMKCGCSNCIGTAYAKGEELWKKEKENESFEKLVQKIAAEHGIQKIVARFRSGGMFHEVEDFLDTVNADSDSWINDLKESGLLPTGRESENKIAQKEEVDATRREAEEKKRMEQEVERNVVREKDRLLLGEALSCNDFETESGLQRLKGLIEQMSPSVCHDINSQIRVRVSRTPWGANDLKSKLKTIGSVSMVCSSVHNSIESVFHLPVSIDNVKFKESQDGEVMFEYSDGLLPGVHTYKVVAGRVGLDGTCAVLETVLLEDQIDLASFNRNERNGTLELYTDIPYADLYATPIEKIILTEKGYSQISTKDQIKQKANKELMRGSNRYPYRVAK